MNIKELDHRVGAVIVTYNPDEQFLDRLSLISSQVERIIIYDNGSSVESLSFLNKIQVKGVSLIYSKDNVGIAKALNVGIEELIKDNYEWILTFDQDSYPSNDMVQQLMSTTDFIECEKSCSRCSKYY